MLLSGSVLTLINVLGAFTATGSRWWRSYFVTQTIAIVSMYLAFAAGAMLGPRALVGEFVPSLLSQLAALTFFVVAVVADLGGKRSRDWLHWLGVVVILPILIAATLLLVPLAIVSVTHAV
jgi:hypothetical protein